MNALGSYMEEQELPLHIIPISQAELQFDLQGLFDIGRILDIHGQIGGDGPGRRVDLEVLNRSGIVLLCAHWQAFVEELAAETLRHLAIEAGSLAALPELLKREIVREIKESKHELA